jgi:hypothetical protein
MFSPPVTSAVCFIHRISINRPTKRGKKKSPSYATLSMIKRDGRPFTGMSIIFEKEPHSDQRG